MDASHPWSPEWSHPDPAPRFAIVLLLVVLMLAALALARPSQTTEMQAADSSAYSMAGAP